MEQKKKFKLPFSGKTRRRIVRTVLTVVGLYLLLMIGLSIYIASSKEKLIGFIRDKLKQTILGELKIDNADITIWQTFPKFGLTLENVSISDSFYHRPFLKAGEIIAKVGILDLIGNKVKISSIKIKDATIHTFTDAKGYTNTYVFRPQNKSKRQSKKPVVLSNLELENVTAIIEDVPQNKRYLARIDEADIDTRLSGSKYYITFDEDLLLGGLGFKVSKGYWLKNQHVQAKWKLEFDTTGSVLTINETKVKIQGQPFIIKGVFKLGASHFHLDAVTKQIPYKAGLAIMKSTTSDKIKKLDLTGPVDVTVMLDGSLAFGSDPEVIADFKTEESNISTPVLDLNDCTLSGTYNNQVDKNILPDDSNSRISINSFISSWGSVDLKAKNIAVTNLIKPVIQFEFFSECTLPELDEALSSSALQFAEGNAKVYLGYNGPLIADPSLLNHLNAKILIQNGKVVYIPRNLTFSECNGAIDLIGNNLVVNNFQCNLNTNHFIVNIAGQNLNRISTREPGKASINCDVYSPELDLSDFKTLFAQKTKAAKRKAGKNLEGAVNSVDNAVENGDLFINIKAKQLLLHHFMASNVIANVVFKDDDWEIKQASLQHADGSLMLTAKVHQVNEQLHQATAQVNLQHINVKKLFYAFDNFGQSGITYHNLNGIMDAKANINAGINSAGKLLVNTMHGQLFFSLKNASLINLESLKNIQNYVFKNRDLSNVQFAEITDTFDIKNGDIYIRRMPIQSSAITMYIEGVYSFADRTDISIQIPFSALTNKPNDNFKQIDKAKAEKPGASIYLRAKDKDGQVKIGLDVFKKVRKKKHKKDN